jgi:lysophospholipase L1-like esterase
MKTLLCYGDSNIPGCIPGSDARYARWERWPGILQQQLGEEYEAIVEGLPARTIIWKDPIEGYKSGKDHLIPCLESHQPLGLVIILLGTNDLKRRFSLSAFDIAEGADILVKMIRKSKVGSEGDAPEVLLLAPPHLGKLSVMDQRSARV